MNKSPLSIIGYRTTVAIAGDDFVVIGSDTRLSSGYVIHTRNQNKLFQLSPTAVLGTSGCWCDALALTALLKARLQMYKHVHSKAMSTEATAQMLSVLMYNKRFFPYYLSNVLAGLDKDGKGVVYSYDPIGHCEKIQCAAGGQAKSLLQSILDHQITHNNMDLEKAEMPAMSLDRATAMVYDTFISATERDIYTGDSLVINVITADGITEKILPLNQD